MEMTLYHAINPILSRSLQILLKQKNVTHKAQGVQDVRPIALESPTGRNPLVFRRRLQQTCST